MNEAAFISELVSKGSIAGLLMVAVWYVAKKFSESQDKLTTTYEARIVALEKASEICEKDRVELRNLILQRLGGQTFRVKNEPPAQ